MGLMQLMVQLGINATAYQTGLKQAQGAAQDFGQKVTSQLGNRLAGIFTLGAMEEGIRRTIEFGSKIQDLSAQTGISTDDLQKFDFAAGQTGTSIEKMIKGVERLSIAMRKARQGDEDMMAALKGIGLTEEQIRTVEAAEAFRLVGDSIKDVGVISGQLRQDLRATMGREALDLLKVFREDVRGLGDDLEKMGFIVPPETIAKLDELDDKFKQLGVGVKSFFADMISLAQTALDGTALLIAGIVEGLNEPVQKGDAPFESFVRGFKGVTAAFEVEEKRKEDLLKEKQERLKNLRESDADREEKDKTKDKRKKEDDKSLAEARKIHEKTEAMRRQRAMGELTDAKQLQLLEREIYEARLDAEAAQQAFTPKGILEKRKAEARLEELEGEKAKLERKMEKDYWAEINEMFKGGKKEIVLRPDTGAGTSIGNIFGVDPNRPVVDKLEVIHLDMVKVISKLGGDRGTTPTEEYPP